MNLDNLKIAINCDWLWPKGWAERVILDMLKIFPNANIFTPYINWEKFPEIDKKKVFTSYLQKPLEIVKKHDLFLPFYPKAFESFDFSKYDIVISSSHSMSKCIITHPQTMHICYCHTPVRYLWSDHKNFSNDPRYKYFPKFILNYFLHKLRILDFLSSQRVDYFISNSNYISKRIKKFYKKDSTTIYPACTIKPTKDYEKQKWEYFLTICRLVPWKNNDLLVKAFNKMKDKKLRIYWIWPEFDRLKSMVEWDNIEILDWNFGFEKRQEIMSKAIAFMHPQKEDFWITPVESNAFWVPVIAYWIWWALETIIEWKTWSFHYTQEIDDIIKVVENFDENIFDQKEMMENAERFNFKNFEKDLKKFVSDKWQEYKKIYF